MPETPENISEASTVPAMPSVPASTDLPMDFSPLIDDETDDFAFTPVPPSPYAKKRRNPWMIALIVVLVIVLLLGGLFIYRRANGASPVRYTQSAATTGNLVVTVSATGPVQAGAIYNLNFATSAPIQSIDVQVGQQVTQGQELAKLDPTALQDAVNQAQNGVNSAQTSLNNAYTSLSNTRNQEAATLNNAYITEQTDLNNCALYGTPNAPGNGGSSGNQAGTPTPTPTPNSANCKQQVTDQYNLAVAQANSSIDNASNQITSAQQQLTNAQTALQTAQDNLKNATLTAPHAGVVESISGMVGENAPSGGSNSSSNSSSGSSSAFIVLVDASTLNVAAQVNEANIAAVAVNQPAQFTVAAYPSQTFSATVTSINTLGQTSSNVVTYLVNLAVDMQSIGSDHVYPGMTATVNITTAERISTLLVPSSALTFSTTAIQDGELSASAIRSAIGNNTVGKGTSGSKGIVVELKNGKLVPVLVTIGLTNGQETEILSGLKAGDQVVVGQTGGKSSSTTTSGTGTGSGRGVFGGGGRGGFGGGNGGN